MGAELKVKSKIDILIDQLNTDLFVQFENGSKFKMGIDWAAIHSEQDKEFMRGVDKKCKQNGLLKLNKI